MTVLLTVGAIILLPAVAAAHRPLFLQEENNCWQSAQFIPQPDISQAVYAELAPGQTHWYRFEAGEELAFYAQMTVPNLAGYEDFAPWFALIGADLSSEGGLPIAVPPGMGAEFAPGTEAGEKFTEPFTQTRYLLRQEMRRHLPAGSYYIAVFHPGGKGAKYALTVGEKEDWRWRDVVSFPLIWLAVRWWYSPSQTVAVMGGLALLAAVLIWLMLGGKLSD